MEILLLKKAIIIKLIALLTALSVQLGYAQKDKPRAGAVVATAITYQWIYSVGGVPIFDTPSGKLEAGTYVKLPNGNHVYDPAPIQKVDDVNMSDDPVANVSGLTEVHIIGRKNYDIFKGSDGSMKAVEITDTEYTELNKPSIQARKPAYSTK